MPAKCSKPYDSSLDGPIHSNGGLASIIGAASGSGAMRNPIDQGREWGDSINSWQNAKDRLEWEKERTKGGREWESDENRLERQHERDERQGSERWKGDQNIIDRGWISGREKQSRDWNTGERREGQDWLTGERQGSEKWQSGESEKSRDWQSGEMGKDRDQRTREQESEQGHERGMQGSEHEWRSGENSAEREEAWRRQQSGQGHESDLQRKEIESEAAAQERDIEAREHQSRLNVELGGYMTQGAAYGANQAGQANLFAAQRARDQKGEGKPLSAPDNTSAGAFQGRRNLESRGEHNVLGGDTFRPSSNIRAPVKNSSFLHGQTPNPKMANMPSGPQGGRAPPARPPPPRDHMRDAQAIVSSWDNRGPKNLSLGRGSLPRQTTSRSVPKQPTTFRMPFKTTPGRVY